MQPISKTANGLYAKMFHVGHQLTGVTKKLVRHDRGAALAEYGLLLALVALVAIAVLVQFGGEIVEVFTEAEEQINDRGPVAAD